MRYVIVAAAILGLSACQTTPTDDPDPPIWGRVDCQPARGNPVLEQQYLQDEAICKGRAELAGTTINAQRGYGGLAYAIESVRLVNDATIASATACMAERGYLRRKRSEHEAACAAIAAQKQSQAPPKRSR